MGGVEIQFLNLTEEMEQEIMLVGKYLGRGHNTSFLLRLLTEQILPENLDKILYMDVDIVVTGSLNELYKYQFNNQIAAAVVKDVVRNNDYTRLNIDPSKTVYFNSGVMLINLEYWREHCVGKCCLNLLKTKSEALFMPDQDALNIILSGKVEYLHPKYNCLTIFYMREEHLKNRVKKSDLSDVIEAAANPIIVHYVFVNKPWYKGEYLPQRHLWEKYLMQSPWHDYPIKWRNGYKGFLKYWSKKSIEHTYAIFGFERPNLFIKTHYPHIQLIFLILYYGFAQWLPNFDTRFIGRISNSIRVWCVKHLFDYTGKQINIGRCAKFGTGKNIRIGYRSNIGAYCRIPSNIKIGDLVMMGPNNFFFNGFTHKTTDPSKPMIDQGLEILPGQTIIEDDIWIGQDCLFMPNIRIGSHSIIGARTVVTKNVPDRTLFAGNPGKVCKNRF